MKKLRILTKGEEQKRASNTLLRGICFISKVPLNKKPYDLVWHAGAETYIFVDQEYTKNKYDLLKD